MSIPTCSAAWQRSRRATRYNDQLPGDAATAEDLMRAARVLKRNAPGDQRRQMPLGEECHEHAEVGAEPLRVEVA